MVRRSDLAAEQKRVSQRWPQTERFDPSDGHFSSCGLAKSQFQTGGEAIWKRHAREVEFARPCERLDVRCRVCGAGGI